MNNQITWILFVSIPNGSQLQIIWRIYFGIPVSVALLTLSNLINNCRVQLNSSSWTTYRDYNTTDMLRISNCCTCYILEYHLSLHIQRPISSCCCTIHPFLIQVFVYLILHFALYRLPILSSVAGCLASTLLLPLLFHHLLVSSDLAIFVALSVSWSRQNLDTLTCTYRY